MGTIALGATNKMFWSEMHKAAMELAVDIYGAEGMLIDAGPESGGWPGAARDKRREGYPVSPMMSSFFFSRSETIWGGTSQIQRNIVGERVLGLPKEPKPPPTPDSDRSRELVREQFRHEFTRSGGQAAPDVAASMVVDLGELVDRAVEVVVEFVVGHPVDLPVDRARMRPIARPCRAGHRAGRRASSTWSTSSAHLIVGIGAVGVDDLAVGKRAADTGGRVRRLGAPGRAGHGARARAGGLAASRLDVTSPD